MMPPPGIISIQMDEGLVEKSLPDIQADRIFIVSRDALEEWIELRKEFGFFEGWTYEDTVEEGDWE